MQDVAVGEVVRYLGIVVVSALDQKLDILCHTHKLLSAGHRHELVLVVGIATRLKDVRLSIA